jgi:hypothetical protein
VADSTVWQPSASQSELVGVSEAQRRNSKPGMVSSLQCITASGHKTNSTSVTTVLSGLTFRTIRDRQEEFKLNRCIGSVCSTD